ncbi:MAG TPA: HAD hydrolase family protein [Ktedonobacteraceae bacterium]|nr:HAD hydrolase family protein [Ktedonobacteraceae bacterium]
MIRIDIPGKGMIELTNAVFDVNGTIAVDGVLIAGVVERLQRLREQLAISILTAGTHGNLAEIERALGIPLQIISTGEDKARFVQQLGPEHVIAFGNGSNDAAMLRLAAIGIAVFATEGISMLALQAADVLARGPLDAIDLVLKPKRLISTLRA